MAQAPLRTSLGGVRPHTRKVFDEVADRWPVWFAWGMGKSGEHKQGRALDFMTFSDGTVKRPGPIRVQVGHDIANYLWANRKRLGVWYVIYRQRIITVAPGKYGRAGVWHDMEDRGSTTANHMDHVHVSLLDKPPAYRAPAPPASATGERTYTVAAGDTLAEIAARFGVTVEAIAGRNRLDDPDRIDVGQRLIIPAAPKPEDTTVADASDVWTVRLDPGPTAERVGGWPEGETYPARDYLIGAAARTRQLVQDEAARYEDTLAKINQVEGRLSEKLDAILAKLEGK